MATLELSDEQVFELVRQLPQGRQDDLLRSILSAKWAAWHQLSDDGQAAARAAASKRHLNWDEMSDEQRLDFMDELVHEDRACKG